MASSPETQEKIAVSVIIPVFNVKEFLPRCLDSVVSQTLRNIEIILVDDGSNDGSENICDEYAQKDKRIKVFHQKNSGASAARNKGIDMASGEYLAFVDSDDEIDLNFCEKLFNKGKSENADMCKGELKRIHINNNIDVTNLNKTIRDKKSKLFFMFFWTTSIYKKSFLDSQKIRFKEGHAMGEDVLFQNQAVVNCGKLSLVDDTYYIYHRRPGSADTVGGLTNQKMNSAIYTYTKITDNLNQNKQNLDREGIVNIYFHSIRNTLGLTGRLKNLDQFKTCFECADDIYKKCPYRSDLKKLLINDLNADHLRPRISLLKQKGIRVPALILDMAYKYRHRKRFIRIIIKLLVNKQRYKKFKRDPSRFFGDSKSSVIKYLGRLYR